MVSKPAREVSNRVGRALSGGGAMATGESLSVRAERAALICLAWRMSHSFGLG
jgi:hypothetical protein